MANCLHLVVTASKQTLADCIDHFSSQDSIVFLDAGVLNLLGPKMDEHMDENILNNTQCHFSLEDLQARGLLPKAQALGVQIRDDKAVVRMLIAHEHCLTWQ